MHHVKEVAAARRHSRHCAAMLQAIAVDADSNFALQPNVPLLHPLVGCP